MGYGLVDIPRYLLRKADRNGWLKHYMLQVWLYLKNNDLFVLFNSLPELALTTTL